MKPIFLTDSWHLRFEGYQYNVTWLYYGSCPYAYWYNQVMGWVKPFHKDDVPKNVLTAFLAYCYNKEFKGDV